MNIEGLEWLTTQLALYYNARLRIIARYKNIPVLDGNRALSSLTNECRKINILLQRRTKVHSSWLMFIPCMCMHCFFVIASDWNICRLRLEKMTTKLFTLIEEPFTGQASSMSMSQKVFVVEYVHKSWQMLGISKRKMSWLPKI